VLGLFLAAGLVIALAVAVACALWSPEPSPMRLVRNLGRWPAPVPRGIDPRPTMVRGAVSFGRGSFRSIGVARAGRVGVAQSALVAGWPFYALGAGASEGWGPPPGSPATPGVTWRAPVYAIPPGAESLFRMSNNEVPLRPIWSGLALDALMYATWLALPAAGLHRGRRATRRRRGRCMTCGYDMRGARPPCPECGAV
jgi:hypothetical protein